MTWNMRLFKSKTSEDVIWYSVREVYYNDDGSIYAYTRDPVDITGDTVEEIKEYLHMILKDIENSPVLEEEKVVCIDPYNDCDDCSCSSTDRTTVS